jgi:hypothetical protein
MFSSKAIAAAIELSEGATWADALSGYSATEVNEVADVLEADGQDETAIALRDWK